MLTHRIAYLLAARDVAPHEILAITFTNKAVARWPPASPRWSGPQARSMRVMTFHSACVRILRREAKRFGYPSSFSIYDQADSAAAGWRSPAASSNLDAKQYPPKAMAAQVSNLKNELIDSRDVRLPGADRAGEGLAEAYAEYQRRLVAAGAMDFGRPDHGHGQPLPGPARGRRAVPPPVQAGAGGRVPGHQPRAIHPDQGTGLGWCPALFLPNGSGPIAPLTLSRLPNCAWSATRTSPSTRSAAPPSATSRSSSRTTRTRRSSCSSRTTARTQNILAAANAVVSRNRGRKPKNLWSDQGAGPPIIGYVADNEHDEAAFVAEEVDRLTDAGCSHAGQVAVFYRTNAQSWVFEEVFIRVGLPYRVVGGVQFYERRRVRDPPRLPPADRQPGGRGVAAAVLNVPKRGIGDRAEDYVAAFAQREHSTFAEALARPADVPGLAAARPRDRGVQHAHHRAAGTVADRARRRPHRGRARPHRATSEALEQSSDLQDASRVENLEELVSVAREYDRDHMTGREAVDAGRLPRAGVPGRRRRTRSSTGRSTAAWSR